MLVHLALSQDLFILVLGCWDTSHCPKTFRSRVGALHTVPGFYVMVLEHFALSQYLLLGHLVLFQDFTLKCWDSSHRPKTGPSDGTLRTVPGLNVKVLRYFALSQELVLGHLVLSQDFTLKCWDALHCPKTSLF